MAGRSFHNCGLAKDAEDAYQAALKVKPNHGASISNLGELYFAAGKVDGARKYWESAIKANPKRTIFPMLAPDSMWTRRITRNGEIRCRCRVPRVGVRRASPADVNV